MTEQSGTSNSQYSMPARPGQDLASHVRPTRFDWTVTRGDYITAQDRGQDSDKSACITGGCRFWKWRPTKESWLCRRSRESRPSSIGCAARFVMRSSVGSLTTLASVEAGTRVTRADASFSTATGTPSFVFFVCFVGIRSWTLNTDH